MKGEALILKQRLHEAIAGRRIKAALYYTFTFDPKFFENYVMLLLVPDQSFTDNAIANNILWRKLYKDNLVPPITVYYDEDVKSLEHPPLLDYNLVGVYMPMVGKNKGNFHPKHSFILLENPDQSNELLVLTGSNNLTFTGWCDNVECVSEQTLINGKYFPREFRRELKDFVENISQEYGKILTPAEDMITHYLSKIGYTKSQEIYLYTSFQGPFLEFLKENVLHDDSIKEVEIISPYFSSSPEILHFLQEQNIAVKIQAPSKDNYCLLDEKVFQAYIDKGIKWYAPQIQDKTYHSKVYRFYGANNIYTIIGSVNLTEPAWRGLERKPKHIYNIESAVMYIEKNEDPAPWLTKQLKPGSVKFMVPAETEENWHERREITEIRFTINWLEKVLSWKAKLKNQCKVRISASQEIDLNDATQLRFDELKNGDIILRSLARKPILEVCEQIGDQSQTHYYYISQKCFAQRPLEFRLSATDIIDAWELLGHEDSELKDWLVNRLEMTTHLHQDESGKLISDKSENRSLLNEMSRHFYGLVKLEEFLFNEQVFKRSKTAQSSHLNDLRYYLTNDNVDTLVSYLQDIKKLFENKEIMSVFYWLILNIILTNFYQNKALARMLRDLYSTDILQSEVKIAFKSMISEIKSWIDNLEKGIDLDSNQLKWGLSIIQSKYAAPG